MKLTYYGHGCLGLETRGLHLLIDPFISGNPLAGEISLDEIPADFILITHAHEDHVADVESIARRTNARLISNFEIVSYYEQHGIQGHPMNLGGKFDFPFGTLKSVTAIHSSVFPDGSSGGNPGGFVIWNEEACIYLAGDSALTMDMQLIPITCPKLDWAVLPVGDNFTMGYEDAALAAGFVQCDRIIGCHYDTFGYIRIDHTAAQSYFTSKGLTLHLPAIGETIQLQAQVHG